MTGYNKTIKKYETILAILYNKTDKDTTSLKFRDLLHDDYVKFVQNRDVKRKFHSYNLINLCLWDKRKNTYICVHFYTKRHHPHC